MFLDYEKVEATNNRAERRLRPAVIQRKVSCGQSHAAEASERIASVGETCVQQGRSVLDCLRAATSLEEGSPFHSAKQVLRQGETSVFYAYEDGRASMKR